MHTTHVPSESHERSHDALQDATRSARDQYIAVDLNGHDLVELQGDLPLEIITDTHGRDGVLISSAAHIERLVAARDRQRSRSPRRMIVSRTLAATSDTLLLASHDEGCDRPF